MALEAASISDNDGVCELKRQRHRHSGSQTRGSSKHGPPRSNDNQRPPELIMRQFAGNVDRCPP